jgi:phosphohistidine phosphatase
LYYGRVKKLWIMRHAKAERGTEGTEGGADIDRPLAGRGQKEAAAAGRRLASAGERPRIIVSSPARRAMETAALVAAAAGGKAAMLQWQALYPGDVAATLAALASLDDAVDSVMLVTHNPFAEDLVSFLCADGRLAVRMATAAIALVQAELPRWSSMGPASMVLTALLSPDIP